MSFTTLLKAFAVTALVKPSLAGYSLEDDYSKDFFGMFEFFTAPDPTDGFVKFVDQGTAQGMGLISSNGSSVTMGVDHTNIASGGRSSVRLTSNKVYNGGLILLDVAHMPTGCGTWPAFWMTGPDWPNNGEIDIIEGVNDQSMNAMTLHTGPGCSITPNEKFSGTISTTNCDVNAPDQYANSGCSIDADGQTNTYGAGLNDINGGVYATVWTDDGISIHFFPRNSIPSDIASGKPNPDSWTTKPLSTFSGGCNFNNSIKDQQIVFDTTFCGDWAGSAWGSSSCAAKSYSCNDYVANNPEAFANAYWEINSLKVYQDDGKGDSASYTDAGPTGIASTEPALLSSLAPIPSVTSASVVTLTGVGSWQTPKANAYAAVVATSSPVVAAAAVATPAPAPAAAAPAASPIDYTPPGGWDSITYPAGTGANLPASAYEARSESAEYKPGDPVSADWFEPGSSGIPVADVPTKKRMHARHLMKHARSAAKNKRRVF